jgi:hypothetical protein
VLGASASMPPRGPRKTCRGSLGEVPLADARLHNAQRSLGRRSISATVARTPPGAASSGENLSAILYETLLS